MTVPLPEMNWFDESHPPHENLTEIPRSGAPSLWWGYTSIEPGPDTRPEVERILIWHWCTHSVWLANGADPEHCTPRWGAAGVGAHDLISTNPLHLEPSLHLPGCCGLHGWVRGGVWQEA